MAKALPPPMHIGICAHVLWKRQGPGLQRLPSLLCGSKHSCVGLWNGDGMRALPLSRSRLMVVVVFSSTASGREPSYDSQRPCSELSNRDKVFPVCVWMSHTLSRACSWTPKVKNKYDAQGDCISCIRLMQPLESMGTKPGLSVPSSRSLPTKSSCVYSEAC